MKKKYKVIIDTDIGDDIDDAFALLLAMELEMDIIGITTVFLNTDERARIVKKMLKLYGKGYEKVPVYAGYGTPLAKEPAEYLHVCQFTDDIENELYAPDSTTPSDAVSFIIDSARKYKDELLIIPIGPFTNIAKAIMKDPEAMNLAKAVIIMGGAYYRQYADWNVICDVEAARIMFERLNNLHCLGADVTHKLKLDAWDDFTITDYRGKNECAKYVSELYRLWKRETKSVGVLHDPLAIYYSTNPAVCLTDRAPIAVIESGYARGLTLNLGEYKKAHLNPEYKNSGFNTDRIHVIAKEVNRELIIREFMKCFK